MYLRPDAAIHVTGVSYALHEAFGTPQIAWRAYERARRSNVVQKLPYIPPGAPPFPSLLRRRRLPTIQEPNNQGPMTPPRTNTRTAGASTRAPVPAASPPRTPDTHTAGASMCAPVTAASPRTPRSSNRTMSHVLPTQSRASPVASARARTPAPVTPQSSTRSGSSRRRQDATDANLRIAVEPATPSSSTTISSPSSIGSWDYPDNRSIEERPFWEANSQAFAVFQGTEHGICSTWSVIR